MYYHVCLVWRSDGDRERRVARLGLARRQLLRNVITPYRLGHNLRLGQNRIPASDVVELTITRSIEPARILLAQAGLASCRGVIRNDVSDLWRAAQHACDVTRQFLTPNDVALADPHPRAAGNGAADHERDHLVLTYGAPTSSPVEVPAFGGAVTPAQAETRFFWSRAREPWMYLVLLGLSEYIADIWQPILGIWLHVMLAVLLIIRGSRRIETAEGKFYLALSIMPMVRILSFTMSPTTFHGVWYYFAAEIPLLAAAVVGARVLGLPLREIGWRAPRSIWLSAAVVASGLAVGWGERFIIQPKALAPGLSLQQALLPAVMLIISTGVVEETLFRGLIQQLATRWLGVLLGILYTTTGWALLHIGWDSAVDVLYVLAVGLVWGSVRYWNRSTLDLGLAHGVANVALFIVLPNVRYTVPLVGFHN